MKLGKRSVVARHCADRTGRRAPLAEEEFRVRRRHHRFVPGGWVSCDGAANARTMQGHRHCAAEYKATAKWVPLFLLSRLRFCLHFCIPRKTHVAAAGSALDEETRARLIEILTGLPQSIE